jgi:hypothetical protein
MLMKLGVKNTNDICLKLGIDEAQEMFVTLSSGVTFWSGSELVGN